MFNRQVAAALDIAKLYRQRERETQEAHDGRPAASVRVYAPGELFTCRMQITRQQKRRQERCAAAVGCLPARAAPGLSILSVRESPGPDPRDCRSVRPPGEGEAMSGQMPDVRHERRVSRSVEELLTSIQLRRRESLDSDDTSHGGRGTSTEGYSSSPLDQQQRSAGHRRNGYLSRQALLKKSSLELETLQRALVVDVKLANNTLIHYLKVRDKYTRKRSIKYDLITAYLQAMSPKRSVDTMIRFSVEPPNREYGYSYWWVAMKMASKIRGGIPPEFRKKLWLSLADKHIESRHVEWERVKRTCLNEHSSPDDDNLGAQIVKDLHRTGCSLFSGSKTEENQALLKMVLLGYARWNKLVGYCQGFNMLAAIVLEVMEWQEDKALKVMIYLIEGVLPTRYFTENMRDLSVDMAVFRDLLQNKLPLLAQHLNKLQAQAQDSITGVSYEPPLLNVFTMQWFLTLFSTCLPKATVLRVWDLIFLDGNQVLLQTALAIWTGLERRVMTVNTADEFYSIMGSLTREMLEFGIMETNDIIQAIFQENPLSPSELFSLRDKYAYNIRPLSNAALAVSGRRHRHHHHHQGSTSTQQQEVHTPPDTRRSSVKLFFSDDEEDTDDFALATWCLSNQDNAEKSPGSMSPATLQRNGKESPRQSGKSSSSPNQANPAGRMSLDISLLKKQYAKIKERQKLAHIIMTGAYASREYSSRKPVQIAVSNLLVGKTPLVRKSKPGPTIQFDLKHHKSSSARLSRRQQDSKEPPNPSLDSVQESLDPEVVCLPTANPKDQETTLTSPASSRTNSTFGSCEDVYESLEESSPGEPTPPPSSGQPKLTEIA